MIRDKNHRMIQCSKCQQAGRAASKELGTELDRTAITRSMLKGVPTVILPDFFPLLSAVW